MNQIKSLNQPQIGSSQAKEGEMLINDDEDKFMSTLE